MEQRSRHPRLLAAAPHDRQACLYDPLQSPWVLAVIHQQGLEFHVARSVAAKSQGEAVLGWLEPWGNLLLLEEESPKTTGKT